MSDGTSGGSNRLPDEPDESSPTPNESIPTPGDPDPTPDGSTPTTCKALTSAELLQQCDKRSECICVSPSSETCLSFYRKVDD